LEDSETPRQVLKIAWGITYAPAGRGGRGREIQKYNVSLLRQNGMHEKNSGIFYDMGQARAEINVIGMPRN
jgi:hypothetical protein